MTWPWPAQMHGTLSGVGRPRHNPADVHSFLEARWGLSVCHGHQRYGGCDPLMICGQTSGEWTEAAASCLDVWFSGAHVRCRLTRKRLWQGGKVAPTAEADSPTWAEKRLDLRSEIFWQRKRQINAARRESCCPEQRWLKLIRKAGLGPQMALKCAAGHLAHWRERRG